jgi:hypothetical protein
MSAAGMIALNWAGTVTLHPTVPTVKKTVVVAATKHSSQGEALVDAR